MRLNAVPLDVAADIGDETPTHRPGVAANEVVRDQQLDGLYAARAAGLTRFFTRRAGYQNARDLMHDAFASVINAMTNPSRPIDRPDAYLSRVAANVAARHARTAARHLFASHVAADDVDLAGPDPHARLEARDMLHRLETAMAHLRPITREIFLAHRLDGYSYREIAERTGLSVKRVEKHMTRAIAALDAMLRQC